MLGKLFNLRRMSLIFIFRGKVPPKPPFCTEIFLVAFFARYVHAVTRKNHLRTLLNSIEKRET